MKRYIVSAHRGIVTIRDRLTNETKRISLHNQDLENFFIEKVKLFNYNINIRKNGKLKTIEQDLRQFEKEFIDKNKQQQIKIQRTIDY